MWSQYNAKELSQFRRKDIGFVFQFYNLMPNLTAEENVLLAASVVGPLRSTPKKILEDVGLAQRVDNFPSQLSGGEQQRVAIARAPREEPRAFCFATSRRGPSIAKTGAAIIKLLTNVVSAYKKTVIIVTHNSKIADIADRLIRIQDGKIILDEKNPSPKKPEEIVW
jgi:putative ABC transport system ATP-binding protein